MSAGLQVINDGGIFQIDELYRNYLYTGESWTFTSAGDHTFTTTSGRVAPQLVFYSTWAATVDSGGHTNNTGGLTFLASTVSGTAWTYRVNGIGTCYLFDLPVQMTASGAGLQVWDQNAQAVFDSNNQPLIVRDNKDFNGPFQFRYYYPVQTLSNAGSIVETTGGAAYVKPSNQTWGWLADSVMHVQAWYFENNHAAGGPPNGTGNEYKFLGAIWASGDTFKASAREYVYTGAYVSWGIGSGWSAKIMFVDLTSILAAPSNPVVSTSMSPGSQSGNTASGSNTFSPETLFVSGGSASSYSWSYPASSGGTWAIANGTSATATPSVSGVAAGGTATATLRCTSVVGGTAYTSDTNLAFTNTTSTGGGVTVSAMSPGNSSPSGATTSNSFAESITVTGGTTVTYSWSVSGTGGTWTIDSGQGTFSAVARVTGVAAGSTASATLTCVVNVDGTDYTKTCSLSFQNTTSTAGVTFNPVPGTYNDGLDTWGVTASQPVTWSWTKSGSTARNTTTPTTSGTPATSFSTTQTDTLTGSTTVCTINLAASGAGSGNWTITVTSPGNGGGGTGGCVTADTFLPVIGQAGNVKVGDQLVIANPLTFVERKGIVSRADLKLADCVRIRTQSGVELDCSTTAPIATEDGSLVLAPDLLGKKVVVCDNGEYRYEMVVSVIEIGEQLIVHITCEDDLFLAGKEPGRYILHHNVKA